MLPIPLLFYRWLHSGFKSKTYYSQRCKRCRCLSLILMKHYSTTEDEFKEYKTPVERIRNFSIIAHVDHGKSTLADRLLEMTGAIKTDSGVNQVLDKLQVEKERGITVKAQTASLNYEIDGIPYLLNLIDTPGHVDFASEVYRSLSACQGVILVVDANDGVQAQTVANFYLAFGADLTIIPVINKIDLKNADPDRVTKELKTLFDIEPQDIIKISAKYGTNCDQVLKAIVKRVPPPNVDREKPLRALVFDSWFDRYKGALSLIYVKDGSIAVGEQISSLHTKKSYEVKSISLLRPQEERISRLYAGQVGFIACNMRTSVEAQIGDTLHSKNIEVEPLSGFKEAKPMVFAGLYPVDSSQFLLLKSALDKLTLNDNAVDITNESSPALGQGWRLGFLGLLHMEVFCQRLDQEYGAQSVITSPGVTYKAKIKGKKNITKYKNDEILFSNPSHFPDLMIVEELYEPMVLGTIITPAKFYGEVVKICLGRRGVEKSTKHIDNERMIIQFVLPLNEMIVNFHDELKSVTSGYASFDYEDNGYQISNVIKLDVLLNGQIVQELSLIVHCTRAIEIAKKLCEKLLNIIPRQMFLITIQAAVGSKILARENLKPFKKDVTAKLYGGDITRRKKLLAQQAEGKKKMRMIGNIALPRETFIDVLKK